MATTNVLYPNAIYIPGGITIAQLTDMTTGHNFADLTEFSAGHAVPLFTGSHSAIPDIKFSHTQIGLMLAQFAAGKYNVAREYNDGTCYAEYRVGDNRGVRDGKTNTTHVYGAMVDNSVCFFESLKCRQGQLAEMRCRFVALQTDSNDPLVFTANVALGGTSTSGDLFTLGPVKINGTFLGGVESWEWNNNLEYEEVMSDGDGFLSYIGVKTARPALTIQTRHGSAIATYGNKGTALSALSCFLRKKLISGINIAAGTASHVKLGATAGTIKSRSLSGDNALCEITIDLHTETEDTSPFSITTSTAIS